MAADRGLSVSVRAWLRRNRWWWTAVVGVSLLAYLHQSVPALEALPSSVGGPSAPRLVHSTLDVLVGGLAGGLLLYLRYHRAAGRSPSGRAGGRDGAEAGAGADGAALSPGTRTNVETFSSTDAIDLYNDRAADGFFPQERTAIERHFTETGARVLDIGCGTGRVTHPLSEMGYEVTGVDVSEPMVAEARSIYPHLDFVVGDATDLQFRDAAFDYVTFSYYGLDYVHPEPERLRALREIRRVLKPGGKLVFSSHNWWNMPLSALFDGSSALRPLWRRQRVLDPRDRYSTVTVIPGDTMVYLSSPLKQWRQLEACGFELVDIVGKRDNLLRFVEMAPHYVARRPVEDG